MNTRIALTIGIPAHARVTPITRSSDGNTRHSTQYPVHTQEPPSTDVYQHCTVDINDTLVASYVPSGYVVYDMSGRTHDI